MCILPQARIGLLVWAVVQLLGPSTTPTMAAEGLPQGSVAVTTEEHVVFDVANPIPSDPQPLPLMARTAPGQLHVETSVADRLWLISTRRLTNSICDANLECPPLAVYRMSPCGRCCPSTLEAYLAARGPDRPAVVYVHGNRMTAAATIQRGLGVYRSTSKRRLDSPIDWVVWSWPSEKETFLVHDFRLKARRTDVQGLYLAWLLREHYRRSQPTGMIGYSFGGRVITGSLHALAGGSLRGRTLPGPAVQGANIDAGLVAPAIENDWMGPRGYHGRSVKNLDRLFLLYNHRDAVLKRYWWLDRIRGSVALGYSGPKSFALRADGSKLSVCSRDCSSYLGLAHTETDYYTSSCNAGATMANLIHDTLISH